MKTLVMIAHPDVASSSSHQFLLQTGKELTQTDYQDVSAHISDSYWNPREALEALLSYDRIIFQFSLYWYQAPAALKIWMDQVFGSINPTQLSEMFKGKELGIVCIAGSRANHYQAGGKHNHTLSELLSPFQAFAHAGEMKYLPIFPIHQFANMTEEEQWRLMIEYACYLETGKYGSFPILQSYILHKLSTVRLPQEGADGQDTVLFETYRHTLDQQAAALEELYQLNQKGGW